MTGVDGSQLLELFEERKVIELDKAEAAVLYECLGKVKRTNSGRIGVLNSEIKNLNFHLNHTSQYAVPKAAVSAEELIARHEAQIDVHRFINHRVDALLAKIKPLR